MATLAWLTVNHVCNLRCSWCYQREQAGSGKFMPIRLARRLVDFLSETKKVKNVILIGGEPTLYEYLFELASYIKRVGMVTNVVSNSIKFANRTFVERAEEAGVEAVTTSVKGSSSKEYLTATGCDVFEAVKTAIRNLEDSNIANQISVTVSTSTMTNWCQMVRFVKDCGAKNFNFSFEKPTILSDNVVFDDRMSPRNIAGFIQDVMYPSLLETGVHFKVEMMFPQCVLRDGFVEQLENENHAFGGCLLVNREGIVFDPDGFVLPCNHFVGYPLGRYGANFSTPEEYLAWKQAGDTGDFYQTAKMAPGERCANCSKWSKCGAGCRLYWLYRGSDELLPSNPV
ncbi:MAG: radical SAM protein [Candidatus Staskawiczbacteria bacterium]|nr:radical SAM protein [Candidatus Staskawiczbacteria bacterium]